MQLDGKNALVTGGGTGIGRAVAKGLAQAGAQVVIVGRREQKLREACVAIGEDLGIRIHAADVSDRAQVRELVEWFGSELGQIDVLVNNAGVNVVDRRMEVLSPHDWDFLINVNATGAFNLVHAVLPQMRQRKDGVIISISSIAGIRPSELGGAAYCAAKHAMDALTKVISLEERENGIRACVISPGEVDTPILEARPVPVSDEHRARILQPEDVAAAAVFVASLPPRACVSELVIKPTTQAFV